MQLFFWPFVSRERKLGEGRKEGSALSLGVKAMGLFHGTKITFCQNFCKNKEAGKTMQTSRKPPSSLLCHLSFPWLCLKSSLNARTRQKWKPNSLSQGPPQKYPKLRHARATNISGCSKEELRSLCVYFQLNVTPKLPLQGLKKLFFFSLVSAELEDLFIFGKRWGYLIYDVMGRRLLGWWGMLSNFSPCPIGKKAK